VLAGGDGSEDVLVVQVRRGEHLDGVEVVGEQVREVGVHPRHPPRPRLGPGLVHVGITDGHDVAVMVFQIAAHVQLGDIACPDDAHPDPVHAR